MECSQELGKFLTGELKEVYTALRVYEVKFSKLKCKLLEWYASQGFKKIRNSRQLLKNLSHKDGESLKLYCMRLEDCVQRAYPRDPKVRRKELKKKLWDSAPQHFVTSLEKLQEVKSLTPGSKTLSWGDIVARAEQMDKAKRRVVCKKVFK